MYSTSNDNSYSGLPPRTQRFSMASKLTLLLTLSFFGIFIVFSLLLYRELAVNIEREQISVIDDEIIGFQSILSVYHKDPRFLREEILLEGSEKQNPKYFARIQDGEGNRLVE